MVPILRAGLIMLESAATMLPSSQTFHVGYARDEATLQVRCSYSDTCLQYLICLGASLADQLSRAAGTCEWSSGKGSNCQAPACAHRVYALLQQCIWLAASTTYQLLRPSA